MMIETMAAGTVTRACVAMWSKRSTLAVMGARTVVSDSGESLSPNMEPAYTAPATRPTLTLSMAIAMIMMAIPAVEAEPLDVPVAVEKIAHSRKPHRAIQRGSTI